eukprot:3815802-Pyramimonas_sp.AAC.1
MARGLGSRAFATATVSVHQLLCRGQGSRASSGRSVAGGPSFAGSPWRRPRRRALRWRAPARSRTPPRAVPVLRHRDDGRQQEYEQREGGCSLSPLASLGEELARLLGQPQGRGRRAELLDVPGREGQAELRGRLAWPNKVFECDAGAVPQTSALELGVVALGSTVGDDRGIARSASFSAAAQA